MDFLGGLNAALSPVSGLRKYHQLASSMPDQRYYVTGPTDRGGSYYWHVRDSRDTEKWAVAWFWGNLPGAEAEARSLCDRLNKREAEKP